MVKGTPGVDTEDWSPANKKQNHNHNQHSDDQFLGHQVSSRTAASRPGNFGAAAIFWQLLKWHFCLLLAFLQVAAIIIFLFAAAGAHFPFCTHTETAAGIT